jgi:acyl carrier protein
MQDKEQILAEIRTAMVELFELEPEKITLTARLYDDLEIDSIDAIDLIDRLRQLSGNKIPAERFRSVRTIGDLVDSVQQLFDEP